MSYVVFTLFVTFSAAQTTYTGILQDQGGAVYNVKAYGATGNGVTDDTTNIGHALSAAEGAGSGATVYFPPGNYCVNGGIILDSSHPSLRLTGGSGTYGTGSTLKVCSTADVTVVAVQGANDAIVSLAISGSSGTAVTSPTVSVASTASNFAITYSNITNGKYALQLSGSDGIIAFSNFSNAYGSALVYATGNNHYIRDKIDQTFPGSTPGIASLSNPLPAWTASTGYSAGNIVTSNNWLLECITAGTSGGSAPTLSTYGTNISDNSVVWKMVAPSTYYGLQLDQSVTATQIEMGDFTGPYTAGLAITNSSGGTVPQSIKVLSSNFGNTIQNNVLAAGGVGLYLGGGNTFTGCLQSGCGLVSFSNNWVGQSYVVGNAFHQGAIGVDNQTGLGLTVTGNKFDGFKTAAFHAAAGQSQFNFSDNDCSKGSAWGTNAACVIVDAGPSNYYIITDNLTHGATTGITDNGTGANKTVGPNQ